MTPDSLTNRLHDIQELDPVGIWPLATGWWLLLAGIALLVLLFIGLRRWRPDWQRYLPRYDGQRTRPVNSQCCATRSVAEK